MKNINNDGNDDNLREFVSANERHPEHWRVRTMVSRGGSCVAATAGFTASKNRWILSTIRRAKSPCFRSSTSKSAHAKDRHALAGVTAGR